MFTRAATSVLQRSIFRRSQISVQLTAEHNPRPLRTKYSFVYNFGYPTINLFNQSQLLLGFFKSTKTTLAVNRCQLTVQGSNSVDVACRGSTVVRWCHGHGYVCTSRGSGSVVRFPVTQDTFQPPSDLSQENESRMNYELYAFIPQFLHLH